MKSWSCAGGLSAVNAIGMQLRDLIDSGLAQWRMGVYINGRCRGKRGESREYAPDSALSVENE